MLQNTLFLSGVLKFPEVFVNNSPLAYAVELENNPVNLRDDINNWGFLLFFICFFITVNVISNRRKYFLYMFSRLFYNKERHSMFFEAVTHETLNKIFLCLQTILLISVIFCYYAIQKHFILIPTLTEMILFLGKSSLFLIIFFLYKFLTYYVAGAIFFKKETVLLWNDIFLSLIGFNGIVLFLPVMIFFYVETIFTFCIFFFIIYLLFNQFFIIYKQYSLFFQSKQHLLYFILYLCTQEIIPLYLVYRGFVYLITQEDTVWMQV